ncbi:AraC family transcriptional regulator [Paenibacillus qinlingensis]|uniref:AraC family L-rhamnose operon transcriptional activator RhaR n=1 Tax=Paenibacillus qinlingensis TaxID=1837343 RepID=A0ABU1P7R4_9BACL|nr:AraC family transcriptional regulator [Paenibacillus qinlingensis]MDR6555366.1 AraC family L-rhamnose operon transcriptional activator RhaR [Paenibacillus qinlingensis]
MYQYKETYAMLNEALTVIQGAQAIFKVHYWGVDPCLYDNQPHKHSFFEICYILDGEGEYSDGDLVFPLRRRTLFCSKPGITHQIRTGQGLNIVYIAFELDENMSEDVVRDAYHELAMHGDVILYEADLQPTVQLWLSLLIREGHGSLPYAAVHAVAYALLVSFPAVFGTTTRSSVVRHKSTHVLMRRAKLYIRDNLSQTLQLKDVADYLSVSERHLSRLFSEGIHENFTNFIRRERIRQATHLLLNSELPIKEIAELTGFSSVHYFSRTFQMEKKLPPGQFRQKEKRYDGE